MEAGRGVMRDEDDGFSLLAWSVCFGLPRSACLHGALLGSLAVGCWFLWGVIMLTGCLIVVSTWVSDGRGHGSPTRQS